MSLTLDDVKQIQADAQKAVSRQFRDAAEDNGWKPTPTPGEEAPAPKRASRAKAADKETNSADEAPASDAKDGE